MNRIFGVLGGIAAGLAVMYFMDPEKGGRRRALLRDKAVGLKNDVTQMAEKNARDMRNRAKGLLHEAKSTFAAGESAESSGVEAGQTT